MAGVSKGAAGEVMAARFLRSKGYTILVSNYRTRFGEIDIIASDGQSRPAARILIMLHGRR